MALQVASPNIEIHQHALEAVPGHSESPADADDDEASSVDTQDAFLDMLGLSRDNTAVDDISSDLPILVMDEEEEEEASHSNSTALSLSTLPIHVPPKCSRYGIPPRKCAAVVVSGFYSEPECLELLHLAKQQPNNFQYITQASHTAPDGTSYLVQLQNPNPHKLTVLEHPPTLHKLWHRLEPYLTQAQWMKDYSARTNFGKPVGLNPRLRVLQYDASDKDRFEPHFDCTTHVGEHCTSRITVLLYLNTGQGHHFDGGETLYLDSHISNYNVVNQNNQGIDSSSSTVKIKPQLGTLVMFEHDLFHAGAPLLWGRKHVLRTDILFDDRHSDTSPSVDTYNKDSAHDAYTHNRNETTQIAENKEGPAIKTTTTTNQPLLVSKLCQELQWSSDERGVLQDMGLYGMTLEAFILPGPTLLTAMLLDGTGLDSSQVMVFIQLAKERVQKQQQEEEKQNY